MAKLRKLRIKRFSVSTRLIGNGKVGLWTPGIKRSKAKRHGNTRDVGVTQIIKPI